MVIGSFKADSECWSNFNVDICWVFGDLIFISEVSAHLKFQLFFLLFRKLHQLLK